MRAEVSSVGAVTTAFRYRSYGQLAQSSVGFASYLGFSGQMLDLSGLIYMRARLYDPAAGRFLSRDVLNGDPKTPSSINLYAYASANPVRMSDPTGHAAIADPYGGGCDPERCRFEPTDDANSTSPGGTPRPTCAPTPPGPAAPTPPASATPRSQTPVATGTARFNSGECLASFLAFDALGTAAVGMEVAGLTLQGASVAAFGVTFGAAAPVSAGGFALGAVFEIAGGLTELFAIFVLIKGCAPQLLSP